MLSVCSLGVLVDVWKWQPFKTPVGLYCQHMHMYLPLFQLLGNFQAVREFFVVSSGDCECNDDER